MPGPAPKDPRNRVRRNKDTVAPTLIEFKPAEQPELPADVGWPDQTRAWWEMWGQSAQAEYFTATDWDFLLDTALLHAEVWGNLDMRHLPELRNRVAKFGATPEDRARLRMQYKDSADATPQHETSGAPRASSARERRSRVVDGGGGVGLATIVPLPTTG